MKYQPITVWTRVSGGKESFHHISNWWRIRKVGCGSKHYNKKHNITWKREFTFLIPVERNDGSYVPQVYTKKSRSVRG